MGACFVRRPGSRVLKFFHDLAIEAGMVMIDAPQHDDANAVFALKLVERLTRLAAHIVFTIL